MIVYQNDTGLKAYPPTGSPEDIEKLRQAAINCGDILESEPYLEQWYKWKSFAEIINNERSEYPDAQELLDITTYRIQEVQPFLLHKLQPFDLEN